MALAAVLAVVHSSHEDTSSALLRRTLPPQPLDLSVSINLVVLEHRQLGLLALVLDLLGGCIDLLLALLGTTAKSEDEVESGLLLDIVVGQRAAIFELLAGKDQALLVRRDAFLVWVAKLETGEQNAFDIVDGVRRLDLKGDGLAREGLDKDLHDEDDSQFLTLRHAIKELLNVVG